MDYGKGIIFDNTIPQLEGLGGYKEPAPWPSFPPTLPGPGDTRYRRLYATELKMTGYLETWNRLTSHADENGPKDNPSPYLLEGSNEIDLGQVLYGFESIFYQHHVPPSTLFPPDEDTYSPSYENFPVKIVNDLAGWIANFATALAEYAYHYRENEPPPDREGFDLNFNEYYDYSNPEADIAGNVDTIGILNAYKVLIQNTLNTDLKLSDVFILYYKGAQFLRPSISLPTSPIKEFYTVVDRWKAFSEYFGFYRKNTSGNYFWVPDNPSEWNNLLAPYSTSNPNGRNYESRLFGFSEFWNTKIVKQAMPIYQQAEFIALSLYLRFNNEVPNSLIERYSTTAAWVKDQTEHFLITSFLDYIKSKIL